MPAFSTYFGTILSRVNQTAPVPLLLLEKLRTWFYSKKTNIPSTAAQSSKTYPQAPNQYRQVKKERDNDGTPKIIHRVLPLSGTTIANLRRFTRPS
jgi:hypothetical protein